MSKIRVGLIRCDTHGGFYGPLLAEHDPVLFDQPVPMGEPAEYSWMRGGNHFYFYTNYCNPTAMTAEFVEGFELVKLWDEHRRAAEMLAKVCLGRPEVCDSYEQVSDDVDLVIVADCNGDGSDHLTLAAPGLTKGVATFVDKPMASTLADAEALLRLAAEHDAPIYSMSILGALPAAAQFKQRLPETGGVQFGQVLGGNTKMAGLIHSVMLALHVFGGGVKLVGGCTGDDPMQVIRLDYGERPDRPPRGVTINTQIGDTPHCALYASAYGPRGAIHSPPLGDFEFPFGAAEILKRLRHMVRERRAPDDLASMVEAVAIAEAALELPPSGKPLPVKTISG